jgi:hypothetical protein
MAEQYKSPEDDHMSSKHIKSIILKYWYFLFSCRFWWFVQLLHVQVLHVHI